MARAKAKKVPMKSKKSGIKTQKLIDQNHLILKKYRQALA